MSARGHEEGVQRYDEWAVAYTDDEGEEHVEAHANALDGFIETMGGQASVHDLVSPVPLGRLSPGRGRQQPPSMRPSTVSRARSVRPAAQCEPTSLWNEERNPQFTAPREELCVELSQREIRKGGDRYSRLRSPSIR